MKLPFLQFYPSDYLVDTRILSLSARGAWVDILCVLHGSSTRGTITFPVRGWSRIMGVSEAEFESAIQEIDSMKVGNVIRCSNGDVTITCRRMLSESITREQTRLRVQNHRNKERNSKSNTPSNANVTGNKSEVRSHKSEEEGGATAPPSEAAAPPPSFSLQADSGEPKTSKKKLKKSDAEWITELVTSPAYRGIDVRREHAKALVWAAANKKTMSRRRFLNWINKCEPTMTSLGHNAPTSTSLPEPNGWRAWVNDNAPDSVYARGGAREGEQWSALDRTTQDWLTKQTTRAEQFQHKKQN
jgi:hypothetical protein